MLADIGKKSNLFHTILWNPLWFSLITTTTLATIITWLFDHLIFLLFSLQTFRCHEPISGEGLIVQKSLAETMAAAAVSESLKNKSPVLTIKRAGRQHNGQWQDFIDREQVRNTPFKKLRLVLFQLSTLAVFCLSLSISKNGRKWSEKFNNFYGKIFAMWKVSLLF